MNFVLIYDPANQPLGQSTDHQGTTTVELGENVEDVMQVITDIGHIGPAKVAGSLQLP